MPNVLFIVENDYFPRDTRVLNEASSISKKGGFKCFVLAPKFRGEKAIELINGRIKCFRFPHYDAKNLFQLVLEYINAFFWIEIFTVFIVLKYKINIIHVANPPDFIIPSLFFFKFTGIKFIFDRHDVSTETFKGKITKKRIGQSLLIFTLEGFERLSLALSNVVISTNNSIMRRNLKNKSIPKNFIVRNSNIIQYLKIEEISKSKKNYLHLGYIGVLQNDYASGVENLVKIGQLLYQKKINFIISIIGYGDGMRYLEKQIISLGLEKMYKILGYIKLRDSLKILKEFDFGIIPWPNIPKNNMHTAKKAMEYMCCGVPVCSLKLKEQLYTTGGIGIHTGTFEDMVNEILKVYNNEIRYQKLRKKSLERFNKYLSWKIQKKELIEAYKYITNN